MNQHPIQAPGVSHSRRVRRAALRRMLVVCAGMLLAACGGLGGEPRIVGVLPTSTPAPTEVGFPVQPPDLMNGAAIFAQHCTRCHGTGGAGDGDLVQSGQITNVANLTTADAAQSQRPSEWETVISNGNGSATTQNMMPPFAGTLTEQERWDVAMYTYTLHYNADQVAIGRMVFTDHCAECHGDQGMGDGTRAASIDGGVANLQNESSMATLSDAAMVDIITGGVSTGMPAWGDQLSPDQIHAVAAYVRTLSLAHADVIAAAPQQVAAAQGTSPAATPSTAATAAVSSTSAPSVPSGTVVATTGTITGRVTNGTSGGTAPASPSVTLFIFPPTGQPTQTSTTAAADGSFHFDNVTLSNDTQYITTTGYRSRVFTSGLVTPDPGATTLDLPVTVYELTEDPSVVEITGLVTQVNAVGSNLEVAQVFSFRNTSDRAFTTSQTTTNGQPISVVVSLPPGSVVTGLGGGQNRYVVLPDQFLVVDTTPVIPGEQHLVQIVYLVPYNGSAIVEQPMQYPVNGPVRLLMNPPDTQVQSNQLPALSLETLGQTQYQSYGAELHLAAGDVVRYDVSGATLDSSQRSSAVIASSSLPVIIVIVIVVEIVGIGGLYLWYRRRRSAKAPTPDLPRGSAGGDPVLMDALIRQIAELDAAYEKGELDDESYQSQRAALKARLADLMTKK